MSPTRTRTRKSRRDRIRTCVADSGVILSHLRTDEPTTDDKSWCMHQSRRKSQWTTGQDNNLHYDTRNSVGLSKENRRLGDFCFARHSGQCTCMVRTTTWEGSRCRDAIGREIPALDKSIVANHCSTNSNSMLLLFNVGAAFADWVLGYRSIWCAVLPYCLVRLLAAVTRELRGRNLIQIER